MKMQHIFFDLDNTLWDHRRNAECILKELFQRENLAEKYSLSFPEFYKEYFNINENLWALLRDGKIEKEYLRETRFPQAFGFFGIDDAALSERFENSFLDELVTYNHLVEGTLDILEYLKNKNYTLHILSNGFCEVTQKKCELSGIAAYFHTITSADETPVRKPHPEIFSYALKKANAAKENSVMVGDDWIADVEGALSFGMDAIFFDVFQDGHPPEVKTVLKLAELQKFL